MKPRSGYVALGAAVHLHAPRMLPIIIVPGIMGTRLKDPNTGKHVWNPVGSPLEGEGLDASPGEFAADYQRLLQTSQELAVADDDTYPGDDATERAVAEQIPGYYGPVPEFYGRLAYRLFTELGEALKPRVLPRIYCCGYDWRLDNAKAALRLARVVDQALRETGEKQVILLAHSMGGLVSRYYCRVLGGEEKVFRLFLLASPTLGAALAYSQLKTGITGLYVKDFADDIESGNVWGAIMEGTRGLDNLPGAISGAATHYHQSLAKLANKGMLYGEGNPDDLGGWDKFKTGLGSTKTALVGLLGDIYIVISLGRGKLLTRAESVYFMRHVTAGYQLLPNMVYCRDYPNWVVFDPMATGHPPTGYMIVHPTLLDAAVGFVGGALDFFVQGSEGIGADVKKEVDAFLHPEGETRNNWRAGRNMDTLAERLVGVGDELEKGGIGDIIAAAGLLKEIYDYFERTFVDCRSRRAFYRDIFTGLLDIPHLRSLSAANLALAVRFDDALTVRAREEDKLSALGLLAKVLEPVASAWEPVFHEYLGDPVRAFFGALVDTDTPEQPTLQGEDDILFIHELMGPTIKKHIGEIEAERAGAAAAEKAAAEERERTKPRMYMHPRTFNLYCNNLPTKGSAWLIPTDVLSNDDHNVVLWELLPDPVAHGYYLSTLGSTPDADDRSFGIGDGTVPAASCNPDDQEQLSCPFLDKKAFSDASHAAFATNDYVIDYVKAKICECLPEFLRG